MKESVNYATQATLPSGHVSGPSPVVDVELTRRDEPELVFLRVDHDEEASHLIPLGTTAAQLLDALSRGAEALRRKVKVHAVLH
jgi:hypothetical protein